MVPALLDGRAARLVLDTGATWTTLTRAAVTRLRLPLDPWVSSTIIGAGGGLEQHQNAIVRAAAVGGTRLIQRGPGAPLSLRVAAIDLGDADGLLGGDVLRHATLDLDIGNARMALRPPGAAAPATAALRLQALFPDLLLAPVRLDGHDLIALLDTGADRSLINARGLYRLGLTPAAIAPDPFVTAAAIGGRFQAQAHRFAEFSFGPIRLPAPLLMVIDQPEAGFDLLLGRDVLSRERLLLSYSALTLGFGAA